jgi:heat shock protein HslJ
LEFNSWVLASIGEIDALGGVPVTVEFVDEGQLQGWTGCNDYSATFSSSAEDGTVQIQDVTVASDNPCRSDAATTQEELFLANLAATASFELSGFDLRLFNADGSLGLTLHSTLPLELEGLQWYASFYADEAGQLTPILPDGPQLTAAFAEEEVSGFSGCYNFVARATVQGDAVTIEPFATGAAGTANAECTEASPLVIQEALYRKALEMAATWELAGPNLRLYDAQGNATAIFLAGPVADAVSQ